jgi:hypothetical protein
MYVVRGFNIFTPTYFIPSVYTKSGGSLVEVKEIYTKSGGVLQKVYNRNLWGPVGQQHPFWQYSMNPEFFDDQGVSYSSFWSTSGGSYSIANGQCSIYINSLSITTSSESKNLATNLVNGSTTAVVKNTNDLTPLNRTDRNGNLIRWSVSGTGIQSNTTVAEILSATEIRLSRNATTTQNSLDINYQRTWETGWSGFTRLQGSVPLQVSGGQTYTLQASPASGTINSSWKFGIVSAPTKGGADFFGTGSQVQEGPEYFDLNNNSWTVTIPSEHSWFRPMITVGHFSETFPTNMPRFYTFNWFRITRAS